MKLKNFDIALIPITFRGTFDPSDTRGSYQAIRAIRITAYERLEQDGSKRSSIALNLNRNPASINKLIHLPLLVIFRIIKGIL